jgi:beta-glucanase (GH16 family)
MRTTKTMNSLFILLAFLSMNCKKSGGGAGNVEPVPSVSIEDLSRAEGNGGSVNFQFNVTLSAAYSKAVTVNYATAEGKAKASEDFTNASGTLTFQPNETSKTISVSVVADDLKEANDDFKINLSNAVNANVLKSSAVGTIENDDTKVGFNNAGYDAPTSYAGYTLAWSDEFNSNTLDNSIWSFENGDGCPNLCGWGNNELEYYRPENLSFQDGKLIIEARQENVGGKNYTSSKILTRGKKSFKFGRIDIRAKLPYGKGIWPAFWLLPQNNVYGGWPKSGEIDLMELVGHEPNRSHGTLHYGPGPGSTQFNRSYTLPSGKFHDEFHVFSLEWKQDQIKWYIDGNLFSTFNKSDAGANTYPFNEEFFLIFNLAVGGNWPGNPDATTYVPQWLIVDYVRVYQ